MQISAFEIAFGAILSKWQLGLSVRLEENLMLLGGLLRVKGTYHGVADVEEGEVEYLVRLQTSWGG